MAQRGSPTNLEAFLATRLKIREAKSKLRQLKSSPPSSVDFSSNDFLSLATTPEFRQDLMIELQRQSLPVGSTGSRLLDGNSQQSEDLEREIAKFHGAPAGLLTNSGFDANVGIFACLPQPDDVIVYDELIHASVHDGMKHSRARAKVSFKHNSIQDLEKVLKQYQQIDPGHNVFVAVESVYSMDGDLAPLVEIIAAQEDMFPHHNCHLIVDEAHATGVYGPKGRGRVSELGLEDKVLVRLHTFGKALACNGAIILCSDIVKLYLLNYARPIIYTTFMSYIALSAIKTAYDWLQAGKTEKLAQRLFYLIEYLHVRLQSLQIPTLSSENQLLTFPLECPDSPIFALVSNDPRALAAHCQAAGFNVRAVMPPTVPEGTERVRVCLHAGNTKEQIDRFVTCIEQWLEHEVSQSHVVRKTAPSSSAASILTMSPVRQTATHLSQKGMVLGLYAKL